MWCRHCLQFTPCWRSASSWRRRELISCCEAGDTELTEPESVYNNTWRRRTKKTYSSLSPTSSLPPSSSSFSSSSSLKHRTTFYLYLAVFSNRLRLRPAGRTRLCGFWVTLRVWTLVNKRFIRRNEAETNRWELTQCSVCSLQKQQPQCEFVHSAAGFYISAPLKFSMQMLLIDGTSSLLNRTTCWVSVCVWTCEELQSFLIYSRQILPELNSRYCS